MLNHRGVYSRALKPYLRSSLPFQSYHGKPGALELTPAITRLPYSTTGYGDAQGDPRGENPTEQGTNRRSRELEHPGPSQHKKPSKSESKSSSESQKPSQKKEDTYGSATENPNKPRTSAKSG